MINTSTAVFSDFPLTTKFIHKKPIIYKDIVVIEPEVNVDRFSKLGKTKIEAHTASYKKLIK